MDIHYCSVISVVEKQNNSEQSELGKKHTESTQGLSLGVGTTRGWSPS